MPYYSLAGSLVIRETTCSSSHQAQPRKYGVFFSVESNHKLTFLLLQSVWLLYKAACDAAGLRIVALNTFCTLWRNTLPFVTVMKPMTDLCQVCQQNATALIVAITFQSIQLVKHAQDHLTSTTKARSYMRGQVEKSRKELERVFTVPDGTVNVPPIGSSPLPCSRTITMHFSFDFAQQVCPVENTMTTLILILPTFRCITLIVPSNPGQFTFLPHGSVGYLGLPVRQSLVR